MTRAEHIAAARARIDALRGTSVRTLEVVAAPKRNDAPVPAPTAKLIVGNRYMLEFLASERTVWTTFEGEAQHPLGPGFRFVTKGGKRIFVYAKDLEPGDADLTILPGGESCHLLVNDGR